MEAELDRLQRYLSKAIPIDPLNQDVQPTVRQSIEDLNAAQWALERTTVLTPTNGIVANLQLTEGCYAKAGTPVATVIDTTRWRLIAAVPENWLEKVRPGDDVYYSLRNYPGRVRTAKVEYVGRGVLQGQGVPSGNLPDTDPRQTRQPDTPQPEQEFQVIIQLEDSLPDQPLRVGMTGRVTIFAGGGFPIVNQLAPILHTVLSCFDFLHPKPSPTVALLGVTAIVGGVIWRRAYANRMNRS
jgi:multidrug resistance efflux pump